MRSCFLCHFFLYFFACFVYHYDMPIGGGGNWRIVTVWLAYRRVVKGVSEELDAEALKVVSASPKWKPGRVNGNKVRTSLTIPVEFKLEKKGGKSSFGIKKY